MMQSTIRTLGRSHPCELSSTTSRRYYDWFRLQPSHKIRSRFCTSWSSTTASEDDHADLSMKNTTIPATAPKSRTTMMKHLQKRRQQAFYTRPKSSWETPMPTAPLPSTISISLSFSSSSTSSSGSSSNHVSHVPPPFKTSSTQQSPPPPPSTSILPGLIVSVITATTGFQTAAWLSDVVSMPISGIPVSILLGMSIYNLSTMNLIEDMKTTTMVAIFRPGIVFATKTVLQTGIVCVAAKLSFGTVLSTGYGCIPVVLAAVGSGMVFIPFAGHMVGLPISMTMLLTAGTSICGVTAITALAPAIRAPPEHVAVAVASTVAFGTAGMLLYPYALHTLCHGNSHVIGMCLGVAIHDTSQVLGAALSYKETFGDEVAFQVAAVTKLVRNLGLVVTIPALTYIHERQQQVQGAKQNKGEEGSGAVFDASLLPPRQQITSTEPTTAAVIVGNITKYMPPFLIAFLAMSTIRSVGDATFVAVVAAANNDPSWMMAWEQFQSIMDWVGNDVSKYALGTAMAGVGLSTSASSLRGVGWKPYAVGGVGAVVVGGTGFIVANLVV